MLVKISVISCVGREFGTTNIYIQVKQQQQKEKKVFTNNFSSITHMRHSHKTTHTHALTHTHTYKQKLKA